MRGPDVPGRVLKAISADVNLWEKGTDVLAGYGEDAVVPLTQPPEVPGTLAAAGSSPRTQRTARWSGTAGGRGAAAPTASGEG